jgi:hypothetical protein
MEETIEGPGTLTSDRTGESWVVDYKITHTVDVVAIRGAAHERRTSVVTVRTTANLQPGEYKLHTPEEIVLLELADGRWEIRV